MARLTRRNVGLLIVILIIIILVFLSLSIYYEGKVFYQYPFSKESEYWIVKLNLPSEEYIEELENKLANGDKLNSNYNNSNAQGQKLSARDLPFTIKEYYLNEDLLSYVSKILNNKVMFGDNSDNYCIFARNYNNPNDFLNWHYDLNYTKGIRYTLVIPVLVDEGNTSEFMIRDRKTGKEYEIPINMGEGVIYDASNVYHSITKQTGNNRRIVVVIPLYTDSRQSFLSKIKSKFRDNLHKIIKV
jgi:hypothetical protein